MGFTKPILLGKVANARRFRRAVTTLLHV